ncbi:hypothetical protein D3C81_1982740 [compost metagenome]
MKRYDVDLALGDTDIKITLHNVQALDFQTAIASAVGFMSTPHDWRCTGVDAASLPPGEPEPLGG